MNNKDWTGNKNSIFKTLGASNHTDKERQNEDYYATDPIAIDVLLNEGGMKFNKDIWEPACGELHLSNRLKEYGYNVRSSDIIDRVHNGEVEIIDFLTYNDPWDGDIITNPPYKCFSEDTECYTKKGWKTWNQLNYEDEILSINPNTLEVEWSEINKIIHYDIDEEVYHFKKSYMDILCTKNHRMFACDKNGIVYKNNDLIHSEDIKKYHYIPRTGYSWKGNNTEYFILPGINGSIYAQPVYKEEIKIPMKDWVAFFGMWLADGYCRHTKNSQGNYRKTVGIKQLYSKAEIIRNILSKLPFSYKEYIDKNRKNPCINFEIHNEQLWEYLIQFGKSSEKFIPSEIKDLNKEMLKIFIDSYFKGDGSDYKSLKSNEIVGRIYRTISKQLSEDIQEILLKLGYLSHITTNNYITSTGNSVTQYSIVYSPDSVYNKYYYPSSKKSIEHYKGLVWCVNLKKNGVFLLRRNGKEFISGNCALPFISHALELIPTGNKVAMFLKLQFLEGKSRKEFFKTNPPKYLFVSSSRILCAKNADFAGMKAGGGSAVAYGWYVWEKGFTGDPIIKWIN